MQVNYLSLFAHVPDALIKLAPLAIVVFLFVMTLSALERSARRKRRGQRSSRPANRGAGWGRQRRSAPWAPPWAEPAQPAPAPSRIPDAADQLRTVMGATFTAKRLLNRGESRVLAALEPLVAELVPGWRVMAQVSLGEVLEGDSVEAFNTINAKRVDFLLVDADFRPRHAIEYQGQGHHQGLAAARDAVKKEALRRAGIGFVEMMADDGPAELRLAMEKIVVGEGVRVFGRARVAGRGS
jgi:Protein of unknown function (DUF2726)